VKIGQYLIKLRRRKSVPVFFGATLYLDTEISRSKTKASSEYIFWRSVNRACVDYIIVSYKLEDGSKK